MSCRRQPDDGAFFEGMLPYLRDARYIRIDDRPLLLIYRATLFPNVTSTIGQWRLLARQHGLEPPYLVAVEFFDVNADLMIAKGFDAVCEFPPIMPGSDQSEVEVATTAAPREFHGRLLDYERLAQWFQRCAPTKYRRFKGVTLGRDNTPRRGAQATVTVNFSLDCYRDWLRKAITQSQRTDPQTQRLVFINAWNEWAEGTYLEPDQHNGLGYLEATRSALLGTAMPAAGLVAPADAVMRDTSGAVASLVSPAPVGRPNESCASSTSVSRLRLVGISCVGNEADIVEAFVRHNLTFLDHLIVLEHNTIDGTREILASLVAEGLPISVEHSADPQFHQVVFTNRLLRTALETYNAQWVFPLDCDEFLLVGTRADLDLALFDAGDAHIRMKWVNYVPSPGDDPEEPNPLRRIRHHYEYPTPTVEDNPWVWKVAVNARMLGDYYLDRYEICRGNHFLTLQNDHRPISAPMLPQRDICLAHFPARSVDQMTKKCALGILSRLGTGGRSGYYGKMWKAMTSGTIDFATVADMAHDCLDTGRYTPEALNGTPTRFAPLPVTSRLSYGGYRLPALGVILKWIERNMLDDQALSDPMWEFTGSAMLPISGTALTYTDPG